MVSFKRGVLGDLVFETRIRDNVALAEAPAQRKDIFAYSRNSPGAADYLSVCQELENRVSALVV